MQADFAMLGCGRDDGPAGRRDRRPRPEDELPAARSRPTARSHGARRGGPQRPDDRDHPRDRSRTPKGKPVMLATGSSMYLPGRPASLGEEVELSEPGDDEDES